MISGYREIIEAFRVEGEKISKKRGIKKGKTEVAMKMKSRGVKADDIIVFIGLSKAYISKLSKKIKNCYSFSLYLKLKRRVINVTIIVI